MYSQQRFALKHNIYTIVYMCSGVWELQLDITAQVPQDVVLAKTTVAVVLSPA